MYCNKCGNEVSPNQQYCNKCGSQLFYNNQQYTVNENFKNNNKRLKIIIIIIVSILIIIGSIEVFIIKTNNKNEYYFNDDISENKDPKEVVQSTTTSSNVTTGKYKTAIITDNIYSGIFINNIEDAKELIIEDSVNQKQKDYPKEIINIENEIINKYSITAVNLKELDVDFAKELENVIENIYTDYPNARGYLTNLTLTNLDMSETGVIALFRPTFLFATSNTKSSRPWVIKTQIELNAKFFLNPERIEATVNASSKSGHFPKNATKYSPVAHELGHYLSFIALLNYCNTNSIVIIDDNHLQNYYDILKNFGDGTFSKVMLDEAYKNYINDKNYIDFDEWRGQISEYALAKDNAGNYIYDETIAEAFHDVYLNKENASVVSKYIVEVLKKYMER